MSLDQLQAVVTIAEEGTLVRAARRLHISQPPLTRKLRALEDELQVALFDRGARGMRLTAAGEALLGSARAILHAVDEAAVQARSAGKTEGRAGADPYDPSPRGAGADLSVAAGPSASQGGPSLRGTG